MLALLRAIVRSDPYRTHLERLVSRSPDDAWFDSCQGWFVTFALQGPKAEQLLLFVLDPPSGTAPRRAMLRAASRVERDDNTITSTPLMLSSIGHR